MIEALVLIGFIGLGQTSGQGIKATHGTAEIRGDYWYVLGDFESAKNKETAYGFSLGTQMFKIGPVRTGLGVQYLDLPKEDYQPATIAYVKINKETERKFGFVVLDLGLGQYNANYIRVMALYGRALTPTWTRIYMFDRQELLESSDKNRRPFETHGFGTQGRLQLVKGFSILGSGQMIWTADNRSELVPENHLILHGQVQYLSPIHIGFTVFGTHANDNKSFVLLNDSVGFAIGLSF